MKTVTLNIDEKLNNDLQKLADNNQQSKEEYIVKILQYKLLEEFITTNESLLRRKAEDAGFSSETDILNGIS
jgi:predicted transcriptional regulator